MYMRNIILIDIYIKCLSNEDILSLDLNALLEQKILLLRLYSNYNDGFIETLGDSYQQ